MRVFLTGAAGFIGFHVARELLARGAEILGVDSFTSFYDPGLKAGRLAELSEAPGFRFVRADISDPAALSEALGDFRPDLVIHLAAQAGVRYSLENPGAYIDANVRGHLNMLELVRHLDPAPRVIYASSSSVYGERPDGPFRETDRCDSPVSVYAATKRAGELLSDAYAGLYGLSLTGLRFFTVYGAWGRPDMAYWLFADAILSGRPIKLFNEGKMRRDFTDVRDIVAGILAVADGKPTAGHTIYNIGASEPVTLARFVAAIEAACERKAVIDLAPMQPGDVGDTFADVSKLKADFGYAPKITIEQGMADFVKWFRGYKGL